MPDEAKPDLLAKAMQCVVEVLALARQGHNALCLSLRADKRAVGCAA